MKKIILLLSLFAFTQAIFAQSQDDFVVLKEAGYYYLTKFDSTSDYSVVNASKIVVFNHTLPISKNIGREINFAVTNEKGEKRNLNSRVLETTEYKGEEHYIVELTFDHMRNEKKVKVILADLSDEKEKLIAGKNWMK